MDQAAEFKQVATTWRPIETAPLDRDVLLWDGSRQFVGRATVKVLQHFAPNTSTENFAVWEYFPRPIHWMALPAPPVAA